MAKLDLKDAFLFLNVCEETSWYQCFVFEGKTYRWKRMIWGTNFAPFVMSTLLRSFSIMVPKIMKCDNLKAILQYIDDFLILGDKDSVNKALKVLRNLLEECGFVVSEEKTSSEAQTKIDWLGFLIDGNTIRIDQKRIWKIQAGL